MGMGSAETLTAKMDALADALREAGVEPERVARILGSAAAATMHALVLDAVLDEQLAASAPASAEAAEREPAVVETPVRIAA
jgi:coenzyme F420-reducing hydrogenase delta subunit